VTRTVLRAAVGAAIVVLVLAGAPAAVSAHATLESTNPDVDSTIDSLPDRVELVFSEPVTALPGSVQVYGPDGERVDDGAPRRGDDGGAVDVGVVAAGQGTYTVSWRVTSDDGHTISGSFVFHVGARTGAADLAEVGSSRSTAVTAWLARVLFAAGIAGVVGVAVVASTGLGSRRPSATPSGAARRLWCASASVAVCGALLGLLARVADATGADLSAAVGDLGPFVTGTRSGMLDAVRLGLTAAMVALVVFWRRRSAVPAVLLLAVAAIAATSAAGHAAVTSLPWLSIPVDAVHFLAAAVWLGGIAVLVGVAGANVAAPAWSRLAGIAVAIVAVTGVVSSVFQLGEPRGLWQTDYGRILAGKVALAAVVGALGWVNRQRLAELTERAGVALRRLRAETVAGIGVLAVTGVLVATPPAADSLEQPFAGSVDVGAVQANVTVDPASVGDNQVHIVFTDDTGRPANVDAAELTVSASGVEPMRVALTPITSSHFAALNAPFGRPGSWTLDLVAVADGENAEASITVPVR
jgi:copper transport protein